MVLCGDFTIDVINVLPEAICRFIQNLTTLQRQIKFCSTVFPISVIRILGEKSIRLELPSGSRKWFHFIVCPGALSYQFCSDANEIVNENN